MDKKIVKCRSIIFNLAIFFVLLGIMLTSCFLDVGEFEKFSDKLDFHLASFDSFVGSNCETEYEVFNNVKRMTVSLKDGKSQAYFNLPKKDSYFIKLYLGFASSEHAIDIYINDILMRHYMSTNAGINSLYLEVNSDITREGRNVLEIAHYDSTNAIILDQLKIRNYRAESGGFYVLSDTVAILKNNFIVRHKVGANLIALIVLCFFGFSAHAVFFRRYFEYLPDKFLKAFIKLFILLSMPILAIYCAVSFSGYFILLPPKLCAGYLFFLAFLLVIISLSIFSTSVNLYSFCKKIIIKIYIFLRKVISLVISCVTNNHAKLLTLGLVILPLTAFLNIYCFYLKSLQFDSIFSPFSCIGTGHDSDCIFQLAWWGALQSGVWWSTMATWANPLIIPILGLFFKFFGIYPGAHYHILLLCLMSVFICFVPYIVISKVNNKPSFGGLIIGFLLAFHPLLISQTPRFMSDLFGLFILSVMIVLYYLSLLRGKIIYFLLLGFTCALSVYARYSFLFVTPALLGIFVVNYGIKFRAVKTLFLHKDAKNFARIVFKALIPVIAFVMFVWIIEYLLFKACGVSGLSVKIGFSRLWCGVSEVGTKGPLLTTGILSKISFSRPLKGIFSTILLYNRNYVKILFASLIILVAVFPKRVKELIMPLGMAIIYFFIMTACNYFTNLPPRYFLPLLLLFSLMLGFITEYLPLFLSFFKIKLKEKVFETIKVFIVIVIVIFSLYHVTLNMSKVIIDRRNQRQYLNFVAQELPGNAIVLVDANADPWTIQKLTNKPVVYNIRHKAFAIYISKVPYKVEDYTRLDDLMENQDKEPLLIFFEAGKELFIIDKYTLSVTRQLYLKHDAYLINKNNYKLKLYKEYNEDKAIYQLMRKDN